MIYLIEDDKSNRELVLYTLQATGYEAIGFESGESFWAALETRVPDLVLLDMMLPGEDGLTILKKLRFFVRLMCQKLRGDWSCTSYMPFGIVAGHREEQLAQGNALLQEEEMPTVPAAAAGGGWSQNWYTPMINKITGVSIKREREIGVFQFSKMYKFLGILAKIPFLSKYIPRPPTTDVPAPE